MRAIPVVVANILGEQAFQVAFVNCDDVIEEITRQLPTQRSATPFCQGLSNEVRTGLTLRDRTAVGTSSPYSASRLKMRNLGADPNGNAMDARRSPRWVLNGHSEDQFPNFLRCLSSPLGPPDLGDQLPVQTESAPVPTHHGFRRDRNEGLLPCGPKSTNGDPEELVEQV